MKDIKIRSGFRVNGLMKYIAFFEVPLIGSYSICDYQGTNDSKEGRYGVRWNGCSIAIQDDDLTIVKQKLGHIMVSDLKKEQKELTQKLNQVNQALEKSNNFEDWIEHYRAYDIK